MNNSVKIWPELQAVIHFTRNHRGEEIEKYGGGIGVHQCPICLHTHICPMFASKGLGKFYCMGTLSDWGMDHKTSAITKRLIRLRNQEVRHKNRANFHKLTVCNMKVVNL